MAFRYFRVLFFIRTSHDTAFFVCYQDAADRVRFFFFFLGGVAVKLQTEGILHDLHRRISCEETSRHFLNESYIRVSLRET